MTHAATELVHLFADQPANRPGDTGEIGLRIAFCTASADDGPAASDVAARTCTVELLNHAGAYQVLTTSSTAAVAGPTLPPGAELVDRGVARVGNEGPARLYELRVQRRAEGGALPTTPSNMDWARRVADVRPPLPDDCMADLIETWKNALDGGHGVVLVTSPDGFLASAAVAELALRVHADGALVLRGGWDQTAPRRYGAFREAFGIYAAECSNSQVRADLDSRGREVARFLPELGARLGSVHSPGPGRHDECRRVGDALADWLRAIAVRDDLLLVLDNVQWADSSSLTLCEQLSDELNERRLLIAVAGAEGDLREREVLDAVAALARDGEGREARITLDPP